MRWVMGLLVLTGSLAQVPGPMSVEVRTFQYGPASLQVTVGAEVVWSNRDAIAHTVTSGTPDRPDGAFSGALADTTAEFHHRFDRAGVYPYFCERHHFMRGEVRVIPPTHGEP